MKVDLKKEGEIRHGGSFVLTASQQKLVNAAQKRGEKEIKIDPDDEQLPKSELKSKANVIDTKTDKKDTTTEE